MNVTKNTFTEVRLMHCIVLFKKNKGRRGRDRMVVIFL